MKKHAYLILAHKDDYVFYSLLKMLDDERNDIFVHMDIKNNGFNTYRVENIVQKSRIFFTKRTNVTWGGYSQIKAELLLLKCSTEQEKYSYYHLISGQDLPIQTQDTIHSFFEIHQGMEFVRFENNEFKYFDRVRYYYWFQEIIGRKKNFLIKALRKFQTSFGIQRNKEILFQKGANWFSITDDLARYVISKEKWIRKTFRYTICCDEVFCRR